MASSEKDRGESLCVLEPDTLIGAPSRGVVAVDVERHRRCHGRTYLLDDRRDSRSCHALSAQVRAYIDALELAGIRGCRADLRLEQHVAVLDDRERPALCDELGHAGPIAVAVAELGV